MTLNNAHGVHVGVSRMMHVITFLLVVLRQQISLRLGQDVDIVGVGNVKRSSVDVIIIQKRVQKSQPQRNPIMQRVVKWNLDLRKKTIALVGTIAIVSNGTNKIVV